ncbi:hypothetical protein [Actinoplanes rectilineatus]|uniref:hypothetical protein n=1 Tax=Actinoplanes rectilineatus TaxID=113571 RepID=UPI0005F2AAB5|nr:hypothetical protein [Actinoplanes rectilineatus]
MDERDTVSLTPAQVLRLLFLLAVTVVVIVVVGSSLRRAEPATTVADAGTDGRRAEGTGILVGEAGVWTSDPEALNKSAGQSVALHAGKATVRVTVTGATIGTVACAPGTVVAVALRVQPASATELPADAFSLVSADGTASTPITACTTNFDPASAFRSLVFAAPDADRVIIGTPAEPEVMWQMS